MFLAYAAGEDVDKPTPITREEYFLCYLGDSSASIPDPITRTEKFIAKVYNDAVETPKPTTRLEYILAYITDGSRDTFDAFTPTTREERFLLNAAEYIKQHSHITFTLSYYNDDGSVLLYSESVAEGGNGEYKGETPTKASTEQYDYSFVGWTKAQGSTTVDADALTGVTADRNVYAVFTATARSYTVTFMNVSTLMDTQTVTYGGTAVYGGTTPTKAETSEYTYTFAGWNTNSSASTADADALTNVTADRTVYAIFTAVSKGYTVYFYNGETLLETVTGVPSGGTATYTGATPTSSQAGYIFSGWSPSNTNITADTSCYAQFKAPYITDSWEVISQRSAAGTAQNYYSVGDCKPIELNGTMGTLTFDHEALYVYILGFNHNTTYEPNGITFGGFKTAATNGVDVCLIDSHYGYRDTTGLKWFNMNHLIGITEKSHNFGGWKGCDMRYDILGSTDTAPSYYDEQVDIDNVGYDASSTCATSPVANTLMSCLPSDLRAVMKPVKKYTDNKGNKSNTSTNVTFSIDYLPLLSEFEIQGVRTYANQYEQNKQAQYAYYIAGNSKIKYNHSSASSAVVWWARSPSYSYSGNFCCVSTGGRASNDNANYSRGVAPCFLV